METGAPRSLAELNKDIKHDLTPDPTWEETGEFHRDSSGSRYPVYVERIPREKRVQQRDADGKVLYHLRPDGSRHRPQYEVTIVGEIVREFVNMPLGNGICQKNYLFRPAPGELERKSAEAAEKGALSDLGKAMREAGLGVPDLVRAIKDRLGMGPVPQPEPEVAPPVAQPPAPSDGTFPKQLARPGTWALDAAHEVAIEKGLEPAFVGKKAAAQDAAAKLATADL